MNRLTTAEVGIIVAKDNDMPYTFKFDRPPAGYAIAGARANDGEALIQFFEFTSSDDGQHFIQRVEGFPNEILERVAATEPRLFPSQVDHMLVTIQKNGEATAHINELAIRERVRAGRAVKAGESVFRDDIIEIASVEIGVPIPADAGYVYLFSKGWRKGLIYDFGPLSPDTSPRLYDPAVLFASAHTHVMFYEKFLLSEADWDALLSAKWFPFAGLRHSTVDKTIAHIREGWGLTDIIAEIAAELRERAPSMLDAWRRHPSFAPHIQILERTIERFQANDYISTTALIYPRVEGILRTHHSSTGAPKKPSQGNLVRTAIADKRDTAKCLLLPERFEKYLNAVYFADFKPSDPNPPMSRNSVSHGVANANDFDQVSAAIGILVAHQLYYCLVRPQMNAVLSGDSDQSLEVEGLTGN